MVESVRFGGMAERSKATVLKTVVGLHPPGVRIPLPPPAKFGTTGCYSGVVAGLTPRNSSLSGKISPNNVHWKIAWIIE